jgi:hypothetical protein
MPPRGRKSPHIGESFDLRALQQRDKFGPRMRRMADRPDLHFSDWQSLQKRRLRHFRQLRHGKNKRDLNGWLSANHG